MLKKVFVVCTFSLQSSDVHQRLLHASCKDFTLVRLEYLLNDTLEFRSLPGVPFIFVTKKLFC